MLGLYYNPISLLFQGLFLAALKYFLPILIITILIRKPIDTGRFRAICISTDAIIYVISVILYFFVSPIIGANWLAALIWSLIAYKLGVSILKERNLLKEPGADICNSLYAEYHASNDIRKKQELLLTFSTIEKNKNYFSASAGWIGRVKAYFSNMLLPDQTNAYDVLLCLISDNKTHEMAKVIIGYFNKAKGMPNESKTKEIYDLISRYWNEYPHKERLNNPVIDAQLVLPNLSGRPVSQTNIVATNNVSPNNTNQPKSENIIIQSKEQTPNNDTASKEFVYAKAANGITVRIPVEKLEQWQKKQDEIREQMKSGTYLPDIEESKGLKELLENSIPQPQPTDTESKAFKARSLGMCPKCNTRIPKDSTFCFRCGYNLKEDE